MMNEIPFRHKCSFITCCKHLYDHHRTARSWHFIIVIDRLNNWSHRMKWHLWWEIIQVFSHHLAASRIAWPRFEYTVTPSKWTALPQVCFVGDFFQKLDMAGWKLLHRVYLFLNFQTSRSLSSMLGVAECELHRTFGVAKSCRRTSRSPQLHHVKTMENAGSQVHMNGVTIFGGPNFYFEELWCQMRCFCCPSWNASKTGRMI